MKLRNNKKTNFNCDFDYVCSDDYSVNDFKMFQIMNILDYIKIRQKNKHHLNDIYTFLDYFNKNTSVKNIILENKLLYITFKEKMLCFQKRVLKNINVHNKSFKKKLSILINNIIDNHF